MKQFKKYLIYTLVLFLSTFSYLFAQTDFRPGYIITNQHDTITGYIDYRGDIRNCRVCSFKPNENSEPVEYLPGELIAYRFTNSKYYIHKEFEIDSVKINGYLEYIVDGIVDLYYYATNKASYYLMENEDNTLVQLDIENKDITFEDNSAKYIFEYKKYIGKLKYIFSQYPEIFPEIDRTSLNHKSLASITKKYHEYVCDDEQCIDYSKKIQWVKLNLALYAGISIPSISVSNGLYSSDNYNNPISPSIGISADLILPQISEKISLQLLADFGITKFESYDKIVYSYQDLYVTNTIEYMPIDISTGLKYTYPKGKIRPVIYAGIGFKQLTALKTVHTEKRIKEGDGVVHTIDKIVFKNFFPGYAINLGFNYYKNNSRFAEFKFAYKTNKRDSVNPIVGIQSFSFTIGYFLTYRNQN